MSQKFAAYDAQGRINAFYDDEDSPPPAGVATLEITDEEWQTCLGLPSYTVVNGALVAPTPPSAAELAAQELIQSAQSMLGAGIALVSTGTPALNGTYACDLLSQMDIIAIETSLNAGKGFPGGVATFGYPDASGVMHSFSEADFTNFAAVVRDYVYALKSVISGARTSLPASNIIIA